MSFILASTSPTRQSLLRHAGVAFEVASPQVDEAALRRQNPLWQVHAVAPALAAAKACDVSQTNRSALVLGADQTLICDGEVFGKPADREQARVQLKRLRGRTHVLQSALCCARHGKSIWSCSETAELTMRDWSDAFLETYLDRMGTDISGSVGGYRIEGLGIQLFRAVRGSHDVILGLPLLPLLDLLRDEGIVAR
jgi:septum formation protein